jgi:hypothetical protein
MLHWTRLCSRLIFLRDSMTNKLNMDNIPSSKLFFVMSPSFDEHFCSPTDGTVSLPYFNLLNFNLNVKEIVRQISIVLMTCSSPFLFQRIFEHFYSSNQGRLQIFLSLPFALKKGNTCLIRQCSIDSSLSTEFRCLVYM